MLGRLSSTFRQSAIVNQVFSSLSSLPFFKHHFHTSTSDPPSPPSNSLHNLRNTHLESSLSTIPLLPNSFILNYSSNFNHKVHFFTDSSACLDDLLLSISHVSPETCRSFFRVSSLTPQQVLEILLGFVSGSRTLLFDSRIVGSLWEIFKREDERKVGFMHLPRSCNIMASMLCGAKMFREVEFLLSAMESRGVLLASDEIFSSLIEGYVDACELDRAIMMYDRMKGKGLVPSFSCYCALIDLLVKERKTNNVLCIYEDLVEMGLGHSDVGALNLDSLVTYLCMSGKIKEARKLLKKTVATGWRPNKAVLREFATVYCEKRDFEDLLGLFAEMKCAPDILVGNKIIFPLCSEFGIERAYSFLCELEDLGFTPNEITFGIFIGWSCHQGKLRDAFVFLSEILSKGLSPDRHSYNALISGLCKAGMEEHAGVILNEMTENGIEPDLQTFRALLAGYSKARRFSEVKLLVNEMVKYGFASMSPLEDPISKAFAALGFNPSTVKLKRDNDAKSFRTEFVDELGNGLYIDTNMDKFEKTLTGVLEESLIPDFNLLVTRQCKLKNVKGALLLVDEMIQRGQELSIPALSSLVKLLCESSCYVEEIPGLLDKMTQSFGLLDHETLNFLVQALSKNGFVDKCTLLVVEMDRKNLPIASATYSALLVGFCKTGRINDVVQFWDLSRKVTWLPEFKDFVTILNCLCQKRMLKILLELFNIMLASNPNKGMQVCDVFVESLCNSGLTELGHNLVNQLQQNHFELNGIIYSHLIKGYSQEKRFSEALTVFDAIPDGKLTLTSDILLLLVTKLCQANRVENAVALKDTFLKEHSVNLVLLYATLIHGLCKTGKIAEADALFMKLYSENIIRNDEIYNALLQGHCQAIDLKTVKELLCVMMRSGHTFSVSTYRSLVSLMCRKGMFNSALGFKTLLLLNNNFSSSIAYNILIFYLFRTGKTLLVNTVLDEMESKGLQLDQVGYSFVIYGLSVCKDMPKSVEYLNAMISKGFRPSNRNLIAVICYLSRKGQIQSALRLSKHMELRGWVHSSSLQYALVEGLLSHGKIIQAERYLVRIADKGLISINIKYDNLIRKFCHYKRPETSVCLLDKMLKQKIIPDSTTYDCVVQSFCAFNKLDRAKDIHNEMLARNLKPSIGTWDLLIEKFCENGRAFQAETLLDSMVKLSETPTKQMYSSVIDRYRLENNMLKASELLWKMQQHGYEPDFTIQWSLISSLKSLGDQKVSNGNQGFLSKLLHESGFPSKGKSKSKSWGLSWFDRKKNM